MHNIMTGRESEKRIPCLAFCGRGNARERTLPAGLLAECPKKAENGRDFDCNFGSDLVRWKQNMPKAVGRFSGKRAEEKPGRREEKNYRALIYEKNFLVSNSLD